MRCALLVGAVLVGVLGACGTEDAAPGPPPSAPTAESSDRPAGGAPTCEVATTIASLPTRIDESSGTAVSRAHPGIIWTHNDSGDGPVVYAVDAAGQAHGAVRVEGAEARDWEDISIAPCAGGHCLFIGDIGDNDAARDHVVLYRVPEPAPGDSVTERAARLEVRYPDGPRDAETLFVLPDERLYLASKGEDGPIELYRVPGTFDDGSVVLERIATLSSGPVELGDRMTGGDATFDGEWVVLRTYRDLLLYRSAELIEGEAVPAGRVDISGLGEVQGEGVAFGEEGLVVLMGEAGPGGVEGTIATLRCVLP